MASFSSQEKEDKNKKHAIIVYSTPSCPYCQMSKQYLKQLGFEFEDVDVSKDRARAIEMVKKSGQMGVPVIDIDGHIIIGFNRPMIDKLLGI
ncbi:glutathione S-transferase N-terminal domain-containing protein [Candidatus Micrarchaeota archaeon]|nr:glutathione S-transferase N-terminal domain-containing protein [Candidatus Micrarchaeota archaeon]